MTDEPENLTLKLVREIRDEQKLFRDDVTVMMEILRRLEKRVEGVEFNLNSMSSQLTDMHAYNRRVEVRVHKIEEKA